MHSVILWGLAFRFCSFYFRPHPPPPQIARKAVTKIRFGAGETRARSPVLTDLTSVFTNHSDLFPASNPPRLSISIPMNRAWVPRPYSLQDPLCPLSTSYPALCSRFLRLAGRGFISPISGLCSFLSFARNAISQLSKWLTHPQSQVLIQCHLYRDRL